MNRMPIRLAPMAGVTDWPFRTLCAQMGADICYTEMISAMGLLCAPKSNVATGHLLAVGEKEAPLIAQIFGRDADVMARAAKELEQTGRYIGIDINMGCPAQKIVSGGQGSALMKEPLLAGRIMETVSKNVLLPVSVKMRLGWDENSQNAVQMAHIARESGIKEITVHGRTRNQHYQGKADWDGIKRVKDSVKITVFANGDIFSASDALYLLKHTGCDGVMVGRGALGNPFLFRQIKALLAGAEETCPTPSDRVRTALDHIEMMCAWKREDIAVKEMRKHIAWYIKGVHGAARMRQKVNLAMTKGELCEALLQLI